MVRFALAVVALVCVFSVWWGISLVRDGWAERLATKELLEKGVFVNGEIVRLEIVEVERRGSDEPGGAVQVPVIGYQVDGRKYETRFKSHNYLTTYVVHQPEAVVYPASDPGDGRIVEEIPQNWFLPMILGTILALVCGFMGYVTGSMALGLKLSKSDAGFVGAVKRRKNHS